MIKQLSINNLGIISDLAHQIWPIAYKEMLTEEQISYMLSRMYDLQILEKAYLGGDTFYTYNFNKEDLGYIHLCAKDSELKLEKIYVLPSYHKTGIGAKLIDFCIEYASTNNFSAIYLHVNRENPSVNFYLKKGFIIDKTEDFDIGNGFFMNDFIMKKYI